MKDCGETKILQSRSRSMGRLDGLGGVIKGLQDQGLDVVSIARMIGCNRKRLALWFEVRSESF